MKRRFAITGIVLLLFVHMAAFGQASSSTLYATGYAGTKLVTIDLSSHAVNVIGPTGYPFSFALAFHPARTAYTITNLFSPSLAQLANFNLSTGAATLVGQPLDQNSPGLNLQIMGMIVSPQGVLYGAAAYPTPTTIYSIDGISGLPSIVGTSATNGELMSFAYDPEGTLYSASCCANPNDLYTVDLTTGKATFVTPLAISSLSVMGIAIDADGTMYATDFVGCPPCSLVYRVDPATGTATMLFNTGIPRVHNIAFSPGSPADQIAALEARVSKLGLLGGIATSLDAELSAALNAVNRGESSTACDILSAFQNHVDALAGRIISGAGVRQLTFANTRLRTALGCD